MWKTYAFASAFFAALTAIFAKLGVRDVNSDLATAIRTLIILFLTWGIVLAGNHLGEIRTLGKNTWIFLILSGVATGLSWLFFGASIAIAIWWLASLLLAAYVKYSGGFGQTYGALTGMMALLLWANLTGIALFGGLAFAAQLEAMRIGVEEPAQPDLWEPEAQRAELFDTGEMTSL